MDVLKTWQDFKKIIDNDCFNIGVQNDNIIFTEELSIILKDSNGQKKSTPPIFGEFRNILLGTESFYYNFISSQEILETINEMKEFDCKKSVNLIPFAKNYTTVDGDSISCVLCVNKDNNQVYRVCFFRWERFVEHKEFQSEKIAKDLEEFLTNQILWYKEGLLRKH